MQRQQWITLLSIPVFLCALVVQPALAETRYRAVVLDNGLLKVGSFTVRLYGIAITPSARICQTWVRPARCGSRAVLALERRVDRFVRCDYVARGNGGTRVGFCRVKDDRDILGPEVDLGAWMIYQGWAVALPEAPFEYHTLERIARNSNRGVWGFQVDSVTFR